MKCPACKAKFKPELYGSAAKSASSRVFVDTTPKTRTSRRTNPIAWIVVILFVLGLLGYIGNKMDSKNRLTFNLEVLRDIPQTTKDGRTIIPISFNQFYDIFCEKNNLTDLQKKTLFNEYYKGAWVAWEGLVSNVNSYWFAYQVRFEYGRNYADDDVIVSFPKSSLDELKQLKIGQKVSYSGQLQSYISPWGVGLDNGRFEKK